MKIGVNTRFLLSHRALEGVGRYTYEIMKRMVNSHPEHQFYFFFDRPYDKEFLFAKNVIPIVLSPPARHPLLFIIWFEWSIKNALKKYEIDVFLSFDGFLSLRSKLPQVLIVHDIAYAHFPEYLPYKHRKYYEYFMPKFLQKASKLLTVSQFVKDDILDKFPALENKEISVAYNALPSHFNNKASIDHAYIENPYFIVPGSIHPRKNTLNILKAFKAFINETKLDFKIVFVGRFMWQPSEELSCLWKEMAVSKLLVHEEEAEDQDMVNWISYSNALIYVSIFEGFGIPVLEGFECKVPVICSNNTSINEVAADAAYKVNPTSVEAIKNAMVAIISQEELRQHLIEKGTQRVKDFNWHESMNIIFSKIEEAASKS